MSESCGDPLVELLELILVTHSPGGDEEEIDRLILPHFERSCVDVRQDAAGNIIGRIPGASSDNPLLIAAHKDELGLIVKRVEPDGCLRVQELGGITPWKYGEGPVDILTPQDTIPGVLSIGSMHSTEETARVHYCRENPVDWASTRVQTRRTRDELRALRVHTGSRVVVARSRKPPLWVGDCICGYALDDKAAVAVMLLVMAELASAFSPPPRDIYFAATSIEEQMSGAAAFAASELPVRSMLALEIGPVEPEYDLELNDSPIVWYKDRLGAYSKPMCDRLVRLGEAIGTGCQRAVYSRAATDASGARLAGAVGEVSVLSFPALNSHG